MNEWVIEDSLTEPTLADRVKETAKRSPKYVRFVARMVKDERVPVRAKAALVLGGSYVVSPIDLIPGLIPVLGQIDDLIVMMAAIGAATRLCPPEVVDAHLADVGLSRADLARDAETAQLAGRWAARKGYDTAKAVTSKGIRLVYSTGHRGYDVLEARVGKRWNRLTSGAETSENDV